MHLGQYILIPKKSSQIIDLADPKVQPGYEKKDLSIEPFILNPGQFILGQTLELVGLESDIGMFIDGSSTVARLGLTVHLSSSFIPPGQDPHIITLEIYNAGPWKVKLSWNLRVGKLVMFQYSEENTITAKTYNRYNGQQEVTGAKIKQNNKS